MLFGMRDFKINLWSCECNQWNSWQYNVLRVFKANNNNYNPYLTIPVHRVQALLLWEYGLQIEI